MTDLIALAERVIGKMDDGEIVLFSVERPCGEEGFIGRCMTASPGVVSKPGYIPFSALLSDGERAKAAALSARAAMETTDEG